VRTFLFRYAFGTEIIRVLGPPDHDGWARVLLRIDVATGDVKPGDPRLGHDVLWMPGFYSLLKSGRIVELT
jgi:hypothetical protein